MFLKNILTMVYKKLSRLNIPVAYGSFSKDEDVFVPYIIFSCTQKDMSYDNIAYLKEFDFNIELYYQTSQLELELEFRDILHEIKGVIDFEQSLLSGHVLLRATFSLLENEYSVDEEENADDEREET